jgi:hypothetical protein
MNISETFENLTTDHLNDFVTRRQEEHLYLDFKEVKDASLASLDDKRNLARALSGFANSSGGVIVWGVEARRNDDGVDCAIALKEIDRVSVLLTRLNQLTGDGVDPTVPGVRHRILETKNGKGFALSLIPESDSGPHMAKLGEDRYYKRSGDSFYKMEHYDIADMFSRRRKPNLALTYRTESLGTEASIILRLQNSGRASARAPYLAVRCKPPFYRSSYGVDGNKNEGLPYLPTSNPDYPWCYAGGLDIAIHPGMVRDIARLSQSHNAKLPPSEDVIIGYALACEDQVLREETLTVPLNQLLGRQ